MIISEPIIFDGVEVKLFQFNGQLNSLTCKVEFMQGQGVNEEDCRDLLTLKTWSQKADISKVRFIHFNTE